MIWQHRDRNAVFAAGDTETRTFSAPYATPLRLIGYSAFTKPAEVNNTYSRAPLRYVPGLYRRNQSCKDILCARSFTSRAARSLHPFFSQYATSGD
jgi:hypothetical protein